jgi:hypothetical protein
MIKPQLKEQWKEIIIWQNTRPRLGTGVLPISLPFFSQRTFVFQHLNSELKQRGKNETIVEIIEG